jgi:FlaA1/EpsC-like NDP-sugar epimerase
VRYDRAIARNGPPAVNDDAVETLLDRAVIRVDVERFGDYLAGRTVLVTGAGGSVGVELCIQLSRLDVGLVLVDQAEASLVGLARALSDEHEFQGAVPVLADIKSPTRILEVFERYRPDVVFHAAAYKHVPLLEASPVEAVATNVFGTKWVADAARLVGASHFVLFSTDKAVQPTNILGQTKAVAEWIVAEAGREAATRKFASVRLGNVVDSSGSILPVFRRQVALGGPVTVTHPGATRYLMTAGEAAGLAIVAGGLADSNSIFWLDSGPPVRIFDLARRVASTASHDVGIEFVGLRAGERRHEQLFSNGDEVTQTPCERIWRSPVLQVDPAWLSRSLAALERHVEHASATGVRAALAEMLAGREQERDLVPAAVVVA